MAEKIIAGVTVNVNVEGYLEDPSQWTRAMATEMAAESGLVLTDKHMEVLNFLRERYLSGEQLTIRRVGNSGLTDIKGFYQLFPGGPLKISSKLAGIPKPTSCV